MMCNNEPPLYLEPYLINKPLHCIRMMYWTCWGDEARIERAVMDGSDRSVIHNTSLVWPNAITLDIATQTLYWADAML